MKLRLASSLVAFAAGALAVALALSLASTALADGDPASDYLLTQSTFLSPYDGHISASEGRKLDAMLASAQKQGFPLKLAVIVTRYDLGAVPILFRRPQTYAKFLAQEIYYYSKGELLVVMPNGYGLSQAKGSVPKADRAALATLPAFDTKDGPALAAAAERAVTALAARRGLQLSASGSSGGSSAWVERGEIAGGALILGSLGAAAAVLWRRRRRSGARS
jgi:hypothetical protein